MKEHLFALEVLLLSAVLAGPAAAHKRGEQPILISIKSMSLDTALKAARAAYPRG